MKRLLSIFIALAAITVAGCAQASREIVLSKETVMDKIRGGWAGKTIGCTYGYPTEFRYCATTISDTTDIPWYEGYVKNTMSSCPGLYDDVYMDLTFVEVFDKKGLDARVEDFATAFAYADYGLCDANQQARFNILNGIMPPASGDWHNNPHADDIDFQIECDYAGLMAPAMPNAAAFYTDGIGHIMNYGDGWYGGVYVAAMYSLAFAYDNVKDIVTEALKTIPEQSKYHQCMSDIIKWHEQYPGDWKTAWDLCQQKWSYDIGCPRAVESDFNIDAIINSAYVVIGLLYGDGDFGKTIDVATRCGLDSDCNPATAGGILGTMLGYSNIPEEWLAGLKGSEDIDFMFTDVSLNKACRMSFDQAMKVIERNGGSTDGDSVIIRCTEPEPVRLEQSFEGLWPKEAREMYVYLPEAGEIAFDGKGVAICYLMKSNEQEYVAQVEVSIDGQVQETVLLPTDYNARKLELYYKYDLDDGSHTMSLRWLNPNDNAPIYITRAVIYGL